MIYLPLTEGHIKQAQAKLKEENLTEPLPGSIAKGEGDLAGKTGELIVHQRYGGLWEPTFDYDILFGKLKADVKTKRTTVEPLQNYDCTVPSTQKNQQCDIYIFTRMLLDYTGVWILGWMKKSTFFRKATMLMEGEFDPPNFICKHDCYRVQVGQLNLMKDDQLK